MFDWESYRNEDRTLDLQALFCSQFYDYEKGGVDEILHGPDSEKFWKAYRKVGRVQEHFKVRSRRAARKLFSKMNTQYGLTPIKE